jgi:hypothetical protein
MTLETLQNEKERLEQRLAYLNVRSTGSDRIEARIKELERHIAGNRAREARKR